MTQEIIKIGLIGAGGNTKLMHIPGFNALENVVIDSVCNRSMESGKRVAEEFGIEKVYDNWLDVMEDPDNDAVCWKRASFKILAFDLCLLNFFKA